MMNIMFAYKMYDRKLSSGELYPIFIDKESVVDKAVVHHAEFHITKQFAPRVGFHTVSVPDAPWLKASDGTYKSSRKGFERVWCRVIIPANEALEGECYNPPVSYAPPRNCMYRVPATKSRHECFVSEWILFDSVLEEAEVEMILNEKCIDPVKTFEPYRKGFEKKMNKEKV